MERTGYILQTLLVQVCILIMVTTPYTLKVIRWLKKKITKKKLLIRHIRVFIK